MYTSKLDTPIGTISIAASEQAVTFIGFKADDPDGPPNEISELAKQQLQEYFEGRRLTFDFPTYQSGTDFQKQVWAELLLVQAGNPISYTALSKRMGNPLAIRAIASANGKNNLMVVVPCHRIIGAQGDLVGYAGGLWRKKWLLEHEAKMTGIGQVSIF